MRVVIVQQNKAFREYVTELMKMDSAVQVIQTFSTIMDCAEVIQMERPDFLIVDTNLVDTTNFQLVEKLSTTVPSMRLVFITSVAIQEAAVRAFELGTFDYILKPFHKERFRAMLNKAKDHFALAKKTTTMICCFKHLHVQTIGMNTAPIYFDWKTPEEKELFSYMIHRRNQLVFKKELRALFFPHVDDSVGNRLLHQTIESINEQLIKSKIHCTIEQFKTYFQLQLFSTVVDVDVWKSTIPSFLNDDSQLQIHLSPFFTYYRGHYFADDSYPWAKYEQKRLQHMWRKAVTKKADEYTKSKRYSEAIQLYLEMQLRLPQFEESYFRLMQLYAEVHDDVGVEMQYMYLQKRMNEQKNGSNLHFIEQWYNKFKLERCT